MGVSLSRSGGAGRGVHLAEKLEQHGTFDLAHGQELHSHTLRIAAPHAPAERHPFLAELTVHIDLAAQVVLGAMTEAQAAFADLDRLRRYQVITVSVADLKMLVEAFVQPAL